jgi:hypothetical protein
VLITSNNGGVSAEQKKLVELNSLQNQNATSNNITLNQMPKRALPLRLLVVVETRQFRCNF